VSLLDRLVILAYLGATLALGLGLGASWRRPAPGGNDRESYLLAGRRLSLPAFVAALVSSWYGGVLGVGEYTFSYGISNWLVFGVPYYLAALIFALLLAGRAQRARVLSLPEQLRQAYGSGAGALAAGVVVATTLPAAYLLTVGLLLGLAFDLPLWQGVLAGALFAVVLNWAGGLRSVVRSNLLQFGLMYGGFAILLGSLMLEHGGLGFLRANLPANHLTWSGGRPLQAILVWYLIALATLVEPTFYLHCFAAKSPQVARRGLLISIVAWCGFDALTTFSGLYARALLDPTLGLSAEAYPRLAAQTLPPGLLGLFDVARFSTVLSTIDSYLFLSATSLGPDLLGQLGDRWRRWRRTAAGPTTASATAPPSPASGDGQRRLTRVGLLLSAGLASGIALVARSVVDIWHDFGTIGTATLLVPAVASFFPRLRLSPRGALLGMALTLPVALVWTLSRRFSTTGEHLLGVEPIFPALGLGLLVWGIDRLRGRRTR